MSVAVSMQILAARSLDGLRLGTGSGFWTAAGPLVAAAVAVALAYYIERKAHGTGKWPKATRAISGFVALAIIFVIIGVLAAIQGRWTPVDDPQSFHGHIAPANYAALDDYASRRGLPASLDDVFGNNETFELERPHDSRGPLRVRYFVDAWGHKMFLSGNTLLSAGPDGTPSTDDDLPIPRPQPTATHPAPNQP